MQLSYTEHSISPDSTITQATIQAWIVNYFSTLLNIDPDTINITSSFERYGLDSALAIAFISDLEDWSEIPLDPTVMYDYPTIETLAAYLMTPVYT